MHFPQTDDKSILVSHVPVSCQLEQYYSESIGENCKNTWYSEWRLLLTCLCYWHMQLLSLNHFLIQEGKLIEFLLAYEK